jgi:hypothetical protein
MVVHNRDRRVNKMMELYRLPDKETLLLTDEQIESMLVKRELRCTCGLFDELAMELRRMQAKKIIEYLDNPCTEHITLLCGFCKKQRDGKCLSNKDCVNHINIRRDCSECWNGIKKEVGSD